MTEPFDPDAASLDADARDERVAALLVVPPLDDVTRGRLVRTALGQAQPRPSRWMAVASVAAALLIGAAAGALLVRDEDPATTAAPRSSRPTSDLEALAPAAGADEADGPVTRLGELGDISTAATLRTAVSEALDRSAGSVDREVLSSYPCGAVSPATLGLVAPNAIGTGTHRGTVVTVVVGTSPDGRPLAVVARQDDCTVVAEVRLDPR